MEIVEIRQKSDKELTALVAELREKVRALRFEAASGALKQVHGFREARTTIARALTELRARAKSPKSPATSSGA